MSALSALYVVADGYSVVVLHFALAVADISIVAHGFIHISRFFAQSTSVLHVIPMKVVTFTGMWYNIALFCGSKIFAVFRQSYVELAGDLD